MASYHLSYYCITSELFGNYITYALDQNLHAYCQFLVQLQPYHLNNLITY